MMGRLVCLLIVLFVSNTYILLCHGNVMEIFNHPEESRLDNHADLRDDMEKPSYYPTDDQIIDDLYTSLDLDDYKNGLYAYNKPDFKTRLLDALSRIKYIDGSLKTRRQANEDQFKTYEQFKQTPYSTYNGNNYISDDSYNNKEKLLKRNTVDFVTFAPRNSFENLLYDEFYKSPNNNPLLAKLPQNEPDIRQSSAIVRPRNDPRYKPNDIENSISSIIDNQIYINNSIALLSSLLKSKKDEKLKARHYLKEPSEYDLKFKRELPGIDASNDTDSDDLSKIEEDIKGLNDRNGKIKEAINEISEKINENGIALPENKRHLHAITKIGDVNTELSFVDKENSEVNNEKENESNNEETVSEVSNFHDEKISDEDDAVDELTEEKEIVENEPQENMSKKHFKLKQSHLEKTEGHSFAYNENEKFRIRRREEEPKTTNNTVDIIPNENNTVNNNISSGGNVTTNNGNSYNNATSLVNINVDNNTNNNNLSQNLNDVQQDKPQAEKAKVVISNPVNSMVAQQLTLIATPPVVHNVTENTTAVETPMILTATKSVKGPVGLAEAANALNSGNEGRSAVEETTCYQNATVDDKCLAYNTTRKPNITDELKIAKQINDYVRNLLVHASKTSMRKELGLCKTYDKAYASVKTNHNDMEDEIMKGMIGCLSKILTGSIKPTPCGEMPPELLQFLDWLLLNGVSARDEFKQYMVNGGMQRKTFLFAKNENSSSEPPAQCEANTQKDAAIVPKGILSDSPRNASVNGSSSLYNNIKKTILSGLSPYLKYSTENQDLSRIYPFPNNHVIANRNVKMSPLYNSRDRPNGYNRYKFFSPLLDPELYRMYPYYRPSKERWNKPNKYADEMLNENPYEDMYLTRSKLNYPHLFNLYPKLTHDQSVGAVSDEDLPQFDNQLTRKQADFDGLS